MMRIPNIRPVWLLALIVVVSTSATILAMRRTSTTWDEIVLVAGGARGFESGKFDLAPEHPPVMQYVYGLPVYLARPSYPVEAPNQPKQGFNFRYDYARQFFWLTGNNAERLAFLGRLPAALCALLLVFSVFAFTRRAAGDGAAVIAASLVAFLPDLLAHGGVSYNDVPLALMYFVAAWALDRVVRKPDWKAAALAGAAVSLAFGVKFSAIALGPVAVVLLLLEIVHRGRDIRWIVRVPVAIVLSLAAAYVTLVLIYRGDVGLAEFRYGLDFTFGHVSGGHGAAAFLLGRKDPAGFWYFFPVAFLFKTAAALHVLAVIALVSLLKADFPSLRELAGHPLRMPVVAASVFGAALLTSNLNIGFRYALPMLAPVCVLIAAGVDVMWRTGGQRLRYLIAALVVWAALSPLTYYPNFLAYISEYGPGRDNGSDVLVDSSLDWGQGLIQLREYMRENGIERVYLSYFGSAMPDGYGIDYVPLFSFVALPPSKLAKPGASDPTHVVISATNLQGSYFPADPFAKFRDTQPEAVVGHTMYVYRLQQ